MLVAADLVKHYGGVFALRGAGITLNPGEVHALVGENGAGKSTLVKLISGVVRPDGGGITLDGAAVEFTGPRDAAGHGIAIVSQEVMTFGDLTVVENLFPHGGVARRTMARRAAPVLDELGLSVRLDARVETLSLADQQLLEICRALLVEPRVLILDEPTSALPRAAADRLAATTRRLAGRGLAVLYISHYLEEVLRIADRVSVLRDGAMVLEAAPVGEVELATLVTAMLGAAGPARAEARASTVRDGAGVEFTGVSVPGLLSEVTFGAPPGGITGVAGLQGAGHETVIDLVCGCLRPATGTVRLPDGTGPRSLRQAVRAGVAYISGDRKGRGLMLDKPLWENITAVSRLGLGRDGVLPPTRRLVDRTRTAIDRLRVRGRPYDQTGQLSGGNQQKAVFAKWLDAAPSVIALDDPTRGVDIGARAEMHDIIRGLAAEGRVVVISSTDLAELTDLCDRVLVFQHGRIVETIAGERLSEHELSLAMNAGFATPGGR